MKLTEKHLLELIDQLPKNINFYYVSGGDSKACLYSVKGESLTVEAARANKDGSFDRANMSSDIISKLCSTILPNVPFKMDSILGASGNTRSVYESLMAHTTEFYVQMIDRSKHLVWVPDSPHCNASMYLLLDNYDSISLEERQRQFFEYAKKKNKADTFAKYQKYLVGSLQKKFAFIKDAIKKVTGGQFSDLWSLSCLDHVLSILEELKEGTLKEENKKIQKGLYALIVDDYLSFLFSKCQNTSGLIAPSVSISNKTTKEMIATKYNRYITAIKTKPFVLLAGISGTGKSRIVRELARACWEPGSEKYKDHEPSNYKMIQVKPNWHDSSELIGFVTRVGGEKFVVGPFLKFLVKALKNPEVPHFLCLDEMNLAPVEQYFAEYLSVIESRKVENGEVVTDPIIDFDSTDAYKSLIDQLFPTEEEERKAYLTEVGGKRLRLPKNLIVVGTVNMDETTFSFSRKVLDRAMSIEMNEVNLRSGLEERHESIGKLGMQELVGTAVEGVDVYADNKEVCDKVLTYLEAVNKQLNGTPFKVAYRTRNEFLLYVVNNLPYKMDEEGKEVAEEMIIARALDEVTSMKILSRIEGDESKIKVSFLTNLMTTIGEQLKAVAQKDYTWEEGKEDKLYSESLAKLYWMKERLSDTGFTDFWG